VLLVGIGNGLEKGVLDNFRNQAKNSLVLWTNLTSLPYKGLRPGRYVQLTDEDTYIIKHNVPEISVLSPRIRYWGNCRITRKTKEGSFAVFGDTDKIARIEAFELESGRIIDRLDMTQKRKICVIGQRVKEILFGNGEDPIGRYIQIMGIFFQVVGVIKQDSVNGDRNKTEQVYIPFTTFQQTFNTMNKVGWYSMIINDKYSMEAVKAKIKKIISQRHIVSPKDQRAIGSWSSYREYKSLKDLFSGIKIFLWIVSCGSLIAGVVGVSNIMFIVVKERTREIGIRKAIGATSWSVIRLILQEAMLITAVAGYLGMVTGVGILELISYAMNVFHIQSDYFTNPEIDIRIAIAACIILLFAGLLSGLFPAYKAAKVNPVEALRSE